MKRIVCYLDVLTLAAGGPLEVGEVVELVRGAGPREGHVIGRARVIRPEPDGVLSLDCRGFGAGIWPIGDGEPA